MDSRGLDLEKRCLRFAKNSRELVKKTELSIWNKNYANQFIRSSSSIGANYIEANEKFSLKDCIFRMKIARKEAKETSYWLNLIESNNSKQQELLLKEAIELTKILSTIILKLEQKKKMANA
jgi:four helix bundle protein